MRPVLANHICRALASPLTFHDFRYLGSGPFKFSQPSFDGVDLASLHSWRPRPRRPPPRRPPRPRPRSRRSRPARRRRRRSERPRAPLATRGIIGRGKVSPAPPHTSKTFCPTAQLASVQLSHCPTVHAPAPLRPRSFHPKGGLRRSIADLSPPRASAPSVGRARSICRPVPAPSVCPVGQRTYS